MTESDPRVGEIQAEAVEAAAKAFIEYGTILPAIKAAAPYIAAKALEDAADGYSGDDDGLTSNGHVRWWLRARAAAVRGEDAHD